LLLGVSLGYGFITYESEGAAAKAVTNLNGNECSCPLNVLVPDQTLRCSAERKLENKIIRVVIARPLPQMQRETTKANIYVAGRETSTEIVFAALGSRFACGAFIQVCPRTAPSKTWTRCSASMVGSWSRAS
jgi:RNA recognition motif-containing protein